MASIIQMFEQTSDTALQSSASELVREVQRSAQATLRQESKESSSKLEKDSSEWVVIENSDLEGYEAQGLPSVSGAYDTPDAKVEEWTKVSAVKQKFENRIESSRSEVSVSSETINQKLKFPLSKSLTLSESLKMILNSHMECQSHQMLALDHRQKKVLTFQRKFPANMPKLIT